MYQDFFGFREPPFRITPDPRVLYRNRCYDEAIAALAYGIEQRKGFLSLVGEVGTGKTTLLRHVLESVSPNVRKAQLAYDVAQLETEKARAGHLPTVDLVGSYGKTNNDNLVGPAATLNLPGTTTQASIGVQLNVPLYAGHSVQNRIKETLALEEKSRNDLDGARRSVTQATRQAFLGVQSGEASVRALEAAEASSKLALEATQLGYKVGVRVNLDVLNAQTQLYTTQRDLARARYDLILTNLRLRQAAGTLKPEDVASVNRYLAP